MGENVEDNLNRPRKEPLGFDSPAEEPVDQLTKRLQRTEEHLLIREEKHSDMIRLLKKSRREFLMVFDSVPAMIWYRDPAGKILRVNQCAADSVNMGIRELVGKNYYDLFPDGAQRSRQQDLQVIQSGEPLRGQLRQFKAFDGRMHWVMVDRMPLRNQKEGTITGVVVFASDVTDQKKAEDQLVRAKKEIEIRNEQLKSAAQKSRQLAEQADRSNRAKSEVLASSSHDLRTPMNAIIGFSELLQSTELDEEQSEYATTIYQSATGLLALINDILDYTKLEAGKLNIQIASCNIAASFVEGIKCMMSPAVRQKGLDFNVQIDPCLSDDFFTDSVRLKQCLINLIGNAIKFTHQGHVAIRVKKHQKGLQPCICFEIEDTGIGIADDKQAKIFQAYSQAEETTDRTYGGTGLGLAITRKLAGLLGGHLSVVSEPGKGSVFSVVLPLFTEAHRSGTRLRQGQGVRLADEAEKPSKGCILVAEGNMPSQLTMNLLLRRVGLEVEVACDTDDVLKKTGEFDFDMILLDLMFDRGRGVEIVRTLRKNHVEVPVIAIADCDLTMMEEAMAAGCNKYLTKPILRRELYDAIDDLKEQVVFEEKFKGNDTERPRPENEDVEDEVLSRQLSEVVEGIFNPEELTQLLPELLDELRQAIDQAADQRAAEVMDVLCDMTAAGASPEILDQARQLRDHCLATPDLREQTQHMIDQLEKLCNEIPLCDGSQSL